MISKRRWFRLLLATTLFALWPGAAGATLKVVTSTADLAAVASAVGGSRVEVRALALPTQDPHFVDARPSLALDLSKADLLIVIGSQLEIGWMPTLQVGSRNGRIQRGERGYLDCSELVNLLDVPKAKVDRSMGDIHPSGNPHYMFDPRAAERVAVGIGKRLSELDPEGKSTYLAATKQFLGKLREARARWEKKLAGARGKEVIAYHRSLTYLADWLGLVVVDHVEPKPGIPPNPSHVAELIAHGKRHALHALIQESFYPTNTSTLVSNKLGVTLIVVPGATNFQKGQGYIAFIDGIVNQIGSVL